MSAKMQIKARTSYTPLVLPRNCPNALLQRA
jgi:hypothetical protein